MDGEGRNTCTSFIVVFKRLFTQERFFFNENSYGGMAYIRETTNILSNPRKNIRLYRGVTLGSIGPILGCGRENKPSPWEPSVL